MSKHSRHLCVVLPNKKQVDLSVERKHLGQDVIHQLCDLLGIRDMNYFGLHFVKDNDHMFLDLKKKLTTYFPKAWKRNTLQERVVLQLKVQYYIINDQLISDEKVCSLYYADLKGGVLRSQSCDQEGRFFQLAAYALQADLGSWREGDVSYFSPHDYFPPWLVSKRGCEYIRRHTPSLHQELAGMDAHDAALQFIQEACSLCDVPLNFYSMSKGKEEQSASVLLGVALTGLHLYEMVSGKQQLFYEFFWSSIDRLTFQGRRFEIKSDGSKLSGSKLVLYTRSALHSQHVLKHIRNSHHVHLLTRHSVQQSQLLHPRPGARPQREVFITDRIDSDQDDSDEELPPLKSYLDTIQQNQSELAEAYSVQNLGEREWQHVWKSEVCVDELEEMYGNELSVDEPEEMHVDELFVDEPEEMYVDDPEEIILMMDLLKGVSVDGPPFMPYCGWYLMGSTKPQ